MRNVVLYLVEAVGFVVFMIGLASIVLVIG